jgi:hypothetical protein
MYNEMLFLSVTNKIILYSNFDLSPLRTLKTYSKSIISFATLQRPILLYRKRRGWNAVSLKVPFRPCYRPILLYRKKRGWNAVSLKVPVEASQLARGRAFFIGG